ncbi:MAG TPA: DNA (cytosine-5-)-methyltransferase [Terriglobia bacterium]|nr:DNA (cytosine-5-)-methyltransferase [Terriglobia bacterium]
MGRLIPLPFLGPSSLELCAGGGGQALGLEAAGFHHVGLVELDRHACETLRHNRPSWNIIRADIRSFDPTPYRGIDLLAGGLPCPPFSRAGKQLGEDDDRNLWPAALRIIAKVKPKAVMFENVRGLLDSVFEDFRNRFSDAEELRGYVTHWKLFNARDFGVSQLRPRVVFVALQEEFSDSWEWPTARRDPVPTVGEKLYDLMRTRGWRMAKQWMVRANEIAPTIVGGSHKHGGPDLGPTRARRQWAALGVDGLGIADEAPSRDFVGMPKLTLQMVARLQGFPNDWAFKGGKTASYRQIGNAFPPPVAEAIASQIRWCLSREIGRSPRRVAVDH